MAVFWVVGRGRTLFEAEVPGRQECWPLWCKFQHSFHPGWLMESVSAWHPPDDSYCACDISWNSQSEGKSLYSVLGIQFSSSSAPCCFWSEPADCHYRSENETQAEGDRIEKWKEPGAPMMSLNPDVSQPPDLPNCWTFCSERQMSYCLRRVKLRFPWPASCKQIPQGWIEHKDELSQMSPNTHQCSRPFQERSFCHCVQIEIDYDFKKFFNEWNFALNDS